MEFTNIRISLFTILLTSSSYCFLVFGQQPTETSVLDTDRNPLLPNTKYYMLTLNGGGLALSIRDRRYPCPPNVMQESNNASVGLSLKIFPADKEQPHINLLTDLNIVFMAATVCVQPTVWRVGEVDGFTGQRYVRSGGVLGRTGPEGVGNWFKMARFGEGYKIVGCRVECGDVGVFVENGRAWLGLGGQPLVVVFKKV